MSAEQPRLAPPPPVEEIRSRLFRILASAAREASCPRCATPVRVLLRRGTRGEATMELVLDAEGRSHSPSCSKDAALDDSRVYWLRLLESVLQFAGDQARCSGCRQSIFWLVHTNGAKAPYSISGLNHFADCPVAGRFRNKKGGD